MDQLCASPVLHFWMHITGDDRWCDRVVFYMDFAQGVFILFPKDVGKDQDPAQRCCHSCVADFLFSLPLGITHL